MKTYAAIAVGVVAALAVAFVAGRYTAPSRTEDRERITTLSTEVSDLTARFTLTANEAQSLREQLDRQTTMARTVKRHVEVRPDGTKTIDTTATTTRDTDEHRDAAASSTSAAQATTTQSSATATHVEAHLDRETITVVERPSWRVAGSVGWTDLRLRPDVFGGEVSRRVLGPFWLGAWARTDSSAGLVLGVEW